MLNTLVLLILGPIWAIITIISLYVYFKIPVRGAPIEPCVFRFLFNITGFIFIALLVESLILLVDLFDLSLISKFLTHTVITLLLPPFISRGLFATAIKYTDTEVNPNIIWMANQLGVASLLYVPVSPATVLVIAFAPLIFT